MIAYDTNILIYALEGTSSLSKAAQLVIQKGEHDGAILTVLAWQELMTGAALNDSNSYDKLSIILNDLSSTKFVPVTQEICERAVALTKRYGRMLYGYDAIHIATAIVYKAETFITNDKTLTSLELKEIMISGL